MTAPACVHCAARLRRPQPADLCRACRQLAWRLFKTQYGHLSPTEWQRQFNRTFGSVEGVLGLLRGRAAA